MAESGSPLRPPKEERERTRGRTTAYRSGGRRDEHVLPAHQPAGDPQLARAQRAGARRMARPRGEGRGRQRRGEGSMKRMATTIKFAPTRPLEPAQGRAVIARPLRHGDVRTVAGVFAGLGEQSRRYRFNGPKPCLTRSELRE